MKERASIAIEYIGKAIGALAFIAFWVWYITSINHLANTIDCPKGDTVAINYFAVPIVQAAVTCEKQ